VLVAGAFVLWRFLRQMTRPAARPAPAPPPPPDPADAYTARLEQELQERR
jgi:hypothetical protein